MGVTHLIRNSRVNLHKSRQNLLDLGIAQDRHTEGSDVCAEVNTVHDVPRHFRHELALSAEDHHVKEIAARQFEAIGHCIDVSPVLPDRVLKMELLRATPTSALERLRPDTLVLTAEYPAILVFRLDDKDAVTADDNMVDLRCFPINCR